MPNSINSFTPVHSSGSHQVSSTGGLNAEQQKFDIQNRFGQARLNVNRQHQQGSATWHIAMSQVRAQFQAEMRLFRQQYNQPLRLVALELDNCDDSFTDSEFQVLDYCARVIRPEVYEEFSEVSLYKETRLHESGMTMVVHPNFETTDTFEPFDEEQAQINITPYSTLSEKITTLVHELASHMIDTMKAAVTGDPHPPEEVGHFTNLSSNSKYHQAMLMVERSWNNIQRVADRVDEEVSLSAVKEDFAEDIGLQVGSYLTYLQVDDDHIEALTERYQNHQLNLNTLSSNEQAGVKANAYFKALQHACDNDLPLSSVRA